MLCSEGGAVNIILHLVHLVNLIFIVLEGFRVNESMVAGPRNCSCGAQRTKQRQCLCPACLLYTSDAADE